MQNNEKLIISNNDYLHLICLKDIVLCKSDNSYTYIFLNEGSKFLTCKSLTKISKELNGSKFIRVNQSYIINSDYIKSIDKKRRCIELVDHTKIPFTITIRELLGFLNFSGAEN